MDLACLAIAISFFGVAISSASRARRLRRWPLVKAHVVHCRKVAPFGRDPRQLQPHPIAVAVILEDGTEQYVTVGHRPNPHIMYFAELVYFIEGVPCSATLTFDAPVDDTVELLVNPTNPREYAGAKPHYFAAALLAASGLLFLLAAAP